MWLLKSAAKLFQLQVHQQDSDLERAELMQQLQVVAFKLFFIFFYSLFL
jgi:hypothetical protein